MKQQIGAKRTVLGVFLLLLTGLLPLRAEDNPVSGDSVPYAEGIRLFFDGSYADAASKFAAAESAAPNNPVYTYFLGLCAYRQGNFPKANEAFQSAAEKEWTAKGRLVDVGSHLRRIQGEERLVIEEARQKAQEQWREKEAARQKSLYGETISRQKAYLSSMRVSAAGLPEAKENSSAANRTADNQNGLPSVPPIAPLARAEQPGRESAELIADQNNDVIVLLKDEYEDASGEKKLKTSLSTATQRRNQLREKRMLYKDPESRPAADGSEFVDIYDEKSLDTGNEAFFDPNEPVEPEEPKESAAGQSAAGSLILTLGNLTQKLGSIGSSAAAGPNVKEKTAALFGADEVKNPFAGQTAEPVSYGPLDPFKADRAYQPK